ncbi:IclR family transcriptional regulator [Leucobacter viscericola]|uniref:IclR family transcriptional regulator n=1 Tax=Leucobacter viscericola TaxID=2714935 RepID=A0A6G7XFD1_9MICO|nr:IclR family transcriptional regulator [Leucobacter viscericola]QIK63304.1 IclR family transcriptional regulator [Leucobacter viscericola]
MVINEDTSAARTVAVLEALAEPSDGERGGHSVSAIARAIGRDKSSVSRQLKSLIELGLVEKNADGGHVLGWRVFTIAARAGDQRLLLFAPAVMRQIGRQTGERVHLSIRRQDEVLTIHTEGPQRAIGTVGWIGRAVPILGTSSGRALMIDDSDEEIRTIFAQTELSELQAQPSEPGHYDQAHRGSNLPRTAEETIERVRQARDQGFAVTVDEHEEGLAAIAAPIRDVHGRIVAAINVSAPTFRIADRVADLSRMIHRAAVYLSSAVSSPASAQRGAQFTIDNEGVGPARPERRSAS